MNKTRAELLEEVADLTDRLAAEERETRHHISRENELQRQLSAKNKAIDALKDQLHGLELTNARLQGIIERVRELDPMNERERQQSASEVAAHLERTALQLRHPMRANGLGFGDQVAAAADEQPPYYRRRD